MSKKDIAKHENEMSNGEFDPMLIINPNDAWIAQHGQPAYNAIMDMFATTGLAPPRRRDLNSRAVFHFRNTHEMVQVQRALNNGVPAAHAFCIPPHLHAALPALQLQPIGRAWIIHKVGGNQSDFGEDERFFLRM
ncbi:hypothetical protein BC936DRAFT_147298 [Jimgerdemannia flammicorona]|uniref:Uncharacterized protein n=1 Tax=Jimgerdemannia flammicorona TaxID=994334 RepID=A0A433DL24_9FUNG|nr:hypothetical protein BC936DRAFT_147298 [Jimgerdemannia flammicorona]